jgi:HK97 family phage portal protein
MSIKARIAQAVKSWLALPELGSITYNGDIPRYLAPGRIQTDNNTIIQACLVSILDAFTDAPLVTVKVDGSGSEEYDYSTRLAALMQRPNPRRKISGRRLMRATVASYELDGNAYWDLTYDRKGDVAEMMYVPHWSIEPVADKKGLLSHYEITMADGSKQRREFDEIVHFAQGINPSNPLKGQSALKSALLQVMTDNEADAYTSEIIRNPAVIGIAVFPSDGDPGADAAQYLTSKINSQFGRGGRGGAWVSSFAGKIQNVGFSPEQLALDKLRRIPEERISAVMNVPAIVAGLGAGLDRSTYSNMGDARKYFARYKIAPLWDAFEEEISIQLAPQTEGFNAGEMAKFDRRQIPDLQPDQDALHERTREDWKADILDLFRTKTILGEEADESDRGVYFSDKKAKMFADPIPADEAGKAFALASRERATQTQGEG